LATGDVVLLFDIVDQKNINNTAKLRYRWKGPYRIRYIGDKNLYFLDTIDGIPFDKYYPP
ncbi:hypothetical protein GE09DRAFT_981782, partial [Coniochaeta sp. 2T2.1]